MFNTQQTLRNMNTFELKDAKTIPDSIQSYALFRDTAMPIVIDNGSYQCRAGWATQIQPSLVFKNLIAKQRKERGKKDGETQVGNDIANIEALRFQLKTQFDRNVVTHFEAQETIFDHIFSRLGIDTDGGVYHPIVLTEAFQNPNYSRNLMSEMLFECYGVPGVVYGVDSLFSFWHNNDCPIHDWATDFKKTGLVISIGYRASHVIPVVSGVVKYHQARRLAMGGAHMSHFLHRLLQLKYPAHFNAITLSRVEELLHEHTYVAKNYDEELAKWMDDEVVEEGEKGGSESTSYYHSHVHRIQLPFVPVSNPILTVEQQKERRRELAKRLVEMNARKREERLAEDEERLHQLLAAQDLLEEGDEIEFEATLKECGLSNESELSKSILQLQARIEKTKQKIASLTTAEESVSDDPKGKFYKDSMDPKDYEEWISNLRKQRREILERQHQRRQRRQDMARRRTVAAQERMRLISELARKEKTKKRPGGGINCSISGGDTDTFGMRDEDWDVYKAINREGGDSDSEEEHERLAEIEETLRRHDPECLRSGDISMRSGGQPLADPAERHQLHVGVERIRAPEVLFQPHMLGVEQGGLAEVIECVLKQFSPEIQQELANNIFISGAAAALPGLLDRLKMELQQMRPFGSKFKLSKPIHPSLDPWYGARNFALDPSLANYQITRADYEEYGGDYLKEHPASNPYIPSPILIESPCSTIASPSFRLSHCASINESTILSIDSFVGTEKEGSSPFKVSEFPSMMFDLLQEAVILVDDE
ncbi:actin-related protein 5 [Hetaerina americana]|uniref:actin-related protein 5 n=1 Tax=Hetaerina americana TaxID=62018 RepID=UPI003A7F2597